MKTGVIKIGTIIRIVAILACGYVLVRSNVEFAMASRMVSQTSRDLASSTGHSDVAGNLTLATTIINRNMNRQFFATAALVLLAVFPYANWKLKKDTEP